jgi:hypothetical protein
MNIANLFATLGYKVDDKGLKQFESSLKSVGKNMAILTATVGAGIYALNKFVDNTLQNTIGLDNFNKQTGLSINKLQEWQRAAQLSNLSISAEEVSGSLTGLQKQIVELHQGRGDAKPFNLLGIQVGGTGKDAIDVLEEVRSSIVNLDNATATNIIAKMGLNPKMINVLRLSNKEFKELSKARFLKKEQRDDIMALGKSFKMLTMEMQILKDQAVAKLSPFLKDMIQDFFKWLRDNGDKVINIMSAIAETVGRFIRGIGNGIVFLAQFIERITGSANGLKSLIAIIGSVMLYAFSPFIAMITAILLLLDDIKSWADGEDNLFGSLYEAIYNIPNLSELLGIGALIYGLTKVVFLATSLSKVMKLSAAASAIMTGGLSLVTGLAAYAAYENSDKIKDFLGFGSNEVAGSDVMSGQLNKNILNNNTLTNSSNSNTNNITHNYDITMNEVSNPQDFIQQIQNINQQSKLTVR